MYGPHTSVLYVRSEVLKTSVSSIGHHFLRVESTPYKIQPDGPGYELVHGTSGMVPYLLSLTPVNSLQASFKAIASHELALLQVVLGCLTRPDRKARGVRIVGDEKIDSTRVPTISFVIVGERPIKSKDIVAAFDRKNKVSVRYGHFYAYTLVSELTPDFDPEDGAVRISLVHYNIIAEANAVVETLEEVLA